MTLTKTKTAFIGAALSVSALACIAILPASAMAGETAAEPAAAATEFNVALTTNGILKSGVQAYKRGDYSKSVAMHKAAIRSRMSKRKTAVAQSNLCASWAMLGDYVQAEKACDTALELRPDYGPAQANRELLGVKLAAK